MSSHSRKQSYVPVGGLEVMFDGSKSFWKSRSNLEVLIVSHTRHLCIEVVAYSSELGAEFRLYCSRMALATKIDPESSEFTKKLSDKKEQFIRKKKTFSPKELSNEVYNDLMQDYIMRRMIVVTENVDLSKELKVALAPQTGDQMNPEDPSVLDFICSAPPPLIPVQITFTKKATASEIQRAQHVLQKERESLQHATKIAELTANASDNFQQMIAEKRRLNKAMKSMSPARLRWIKAINMVLIQQYIEHVKKRLLDSSFRDWYLESCEKQAKAEKEAAAEQAAAERLAARAAAEQEQIDASKATAAAAAASVAQAQNEAVHQRSQRGQRSVKQRRSIDNSSLPLINSASYDDATDEEGIVKVGSADSPVTLPKLQIGGSSSSKAEKLRADPMAKRREAKALYESSGSAKAIKQGRRTFCGETDYQRFSEPRSLTAVSNSLSADAGAGGGGGGARPMPGDRPPSLLQSYSAKLIKVPEAFAAPTVTPVVSSLRRLQATATSGKNQRPRGYTD
mmetsp:Transcript_46019/g.94142  ORF Transcript_46019/g.94142 Transcript_46019/m.94142 type:complete len:511 (-) Transcript_46019:315-1847(-)